MPKSTSANFYILKYNHLGRDGRVAIACSTSGNLCVLKFLVENEEELVSKECRYWNTLWKTNCRVVIVKGRYALLIPFCFDFRQGSPNPPFRGPDVWNLRTDSTRLGIIEEIKEDNNGNRQKLQVYRNDPMLAAGKALDRLALCNFQHDDLKWSHVALLPVFTGKSDSFELTPVLLDLTGVTEGVASAEDMVKGWKSHLRDQLDNYKSKLHKRKRSS